jgi:predicted glutamine amidotransferase
MCRIFFAFQAENTKTKMLEFLKQTDHERKFTPGLDNPMDPDQCKDGFGFAWLLSESNSRFSPNNRNPWKIYKNTRTYNKDETILAKIDHIPKTMVLGHLRQANYGGKTLENTQPFVFGPFVMIHNGIIRDFEKVKPILENFIADEYKPHIRGDTDSEYLFFAFITAYNQKKHGSKKSHIENSVHSVFDYMAKSNIVWLANIVFGKPDEIYIGRHHHGDFYKAGLSLYFDNGKNMVNDSFDDISSFVVTSEPVSENYILIPENSGFVLSNR